MQLADRPDTLDACYHIRFGDVMQSFPQSTIATHPRGLVLFVHKKQLDEGCPSRFLRRRWTQASQDFQHV